jgi:hypothetical protein
MMRVLETASKQSKLRLGAAAHPGRDSHHSANQKLEAVVIKMVQKCCEQLIFRISSGCTVPSIDSPNLVGVICDEQAPDDVVVSFLLQLFAATTAHSSEILSCYESIIGCCSNPAQVPILSARLAPVLQSSIATKVYLPLLHSLCLCCHNYRVVQGVLSLVMEQTDLLRRICNISPGCQLAERLLEESLSTAERLSASVDEFDNADTISKNGWKTLPHAAFEQDASYSIEDGGKTYIATTSTNGCALVDVCFTENQKGAWEFLLVADTAGKDIKEKSFCAARCIYAIGVVFL